MKVKFSNFTGDLSGIPLDRMRTNWSELSKLLEAPWFDELVHWEEIESWLLDLLDESDVHGISVCCALHWCTWREAAEACCRDLVTALEKREQEALSELLANA